MKNIVKWMESITAEEFRDIAEEFLPPCDRCPAVRFCHAYDDDKCCKEEFYKWALLECDEEGGAR